MNESASATLRGTLSKSAWTSLSAIGAAVLASSCCLGPLILAAVGIGTIGVAGTLEKFRPYLIALALAVLGVAFYLTYQKRPSGCHDGSCESRHVSRWSRLGLWVVALIVLGTLTFPSWSQVLLNGGTQSVMTGPALRYSVSGMTCAGCSVTVQRSLSAVPGVKSAIVDFESATARVEMAADKPPATSVLVEAVEAAGYSITPIDDKQPEESQ